ncbi:hypothetical protein FNV43_RR02194 [Rhamnella rubrinervis]|uniref:UspA domain-containing protein n=1 Tax=Rhamnella rubrinervis TaxID=2594499 RepID=A0A8K0MSR8_9ROSA|nr:hypothetical protein FNV43_RR02194 [Rhamnella rubrinervis]
MEGGNNAGGGRGARKVVMVVAEPNRESAGALQYALSHAVLQHDELILLHVEHPVSWLNTFSSFLRRPSLSSGSSINYNSHSNNNTNNSDNTNVNNNNGSLESCMGDVDFLEEMKNACRASQPNVRVRVERVIMEGKDKAAAILSQSKTHGVDVLVIGQRRSFSTAILGHKRSGGSTRGRIAVDTAEFLIENSKCTCVAVQKKGQNAGYFLNTKTHRNFWLLA